MTTPPTDPPSDLFLNVRRACRLLHAYQTMVRDAVGYIAAQLDIPPYRVWSRFVEQDTTGGVRTFDQTAWSYLPLMCSEFFLIKETEDQPFSLSIFVFSDTGFVQGASQSKEDVAAFAAPEASTARLAWIMRWGRHTPFYFMEEKAPLWDFIKPGGVLPASVLDQTDKDFVGRSYDLSVLTTEQGANQVVLDLVNTACEHAFPLGLKKASGPD